LKKFRPSLRFSIKKNRPFQLTILLLKWTFYFILTNQFFLIEKSIFSKYFAFVVAFFFFFSFKKCFQKFIFQRVNSVKAMKNFIIKSHKTDKNYSKSYFFILCKGMNSGKPLKTPCPNCFVIQFESETDKEEAFYIALSLWKAKFWHPFLIGSVIPFIRINDFKANFLNRLNLILTNPDKHQKNIAALNLLNQKQAEFEHKLKLINDFQKVILSYYSHL
jgi:hypothetical protein